VHPRLNRATLVLHSLRGWLLADHALAPSLGSRRGELGVPAPTCAARVLSACLGTSSAAFRAPSHRAHYTRCGR
jgi:hypothetical protein